ncbi:uncharacterized protein F5Z01DRAFT_641234 [Emericellopsis atlantica]|uniref:Uncharacterized protein n=1 Tax=Emericellopsis atlantica TaxID=2614577 RepID=A0A9P8CJF0_9HYPO|nr:uncharacterized protein F5Z01DRAFT_641234 [Emericellopsis atlantica]KAG9249404.1 hypothetical protein F5Z01DRAFT_641234 [Emericellopsis atlantica]
MIAIRQYNALWPAQQYCNLLTATFLPSTKISSEDVENYCPHTSIRTDHTDERPEKGILPLPPVATLRSHRSYGGSTLCQSIGGDGCDSLSTITTTNSILSCADSDTTSMADGLDIGQLRRRELADENQLAGHKLTDGRIPGEARILCAGSGAVAWGRQTAVENPLSTVVILEEEPYSTYLPRNCTMEGGDIIEYPRKDWDYVFIRNYRAVTDWKQYLSHLRSILQPGGQIELVDVHNAAAAICTCAQHPTEWAKAKAKRCGTCFKYPSVKARGNMLRAYGFSELTVVYHNRPRRTQRKALVSSVAILGKACGGADSDC